MNADNYRSPQELLKIIGRHNILYYLIASIILMTCVDVPKAYQYRWQNVTAWRDYPIQFDPASQTLDKKKLRRSLLYYQWLTEVSPGLSRSHGLIGWCHYLLGNTSQSLLAYRKALRKQSRFFWFYYNLGVLYYERGEYQKSIQFLNNITTQPTEQMLFAAIFFNALNTLKKDQKAMLYTQARAFTLKVQSDTQKLLLLNHAHLKNKNILMDNTFKPAPVIHPWIKFIPLGHESRFSTLFGGAS